jgi:hypothetical protein
MLSMMTISSEALALAGSGLQGQKQQQPCERNKSRCEQVIAMWEAY